MKTIITWKLVKKSLEKDVAVMLLYVLESNGSSPGRQGFFMAVNAGGEMEGSIGGGIMEHKFVEMAKERLQADSKEDLSIRKQVHDKSAAKNQSGMICSGEQTILLYKVKKSDAPVINTIIHSLEKWDNGTLTLDPGGIHFSESIPLKNFEYRFQSESDWRYQEKTGYKNRLYIIGGGHCALALSILMRSMDFYISVYDERKSLKTMVENDAAHAKYSIAGYEELKEIIPAGPDHYVAIMTFGYRTDDLALRSLLRKEFAYCGLLGSRKKTEKLLADYKKEGLPEALLQRIHTPIGLPIKSQTPEEIAVSIAAEIIREKNKHL